MKTAPSFDETQSILHHAKTRSNLYYEKQQITSFLYNVVNLAHFQQELLLSCSWACYAMLFIIYYAMHVLGMSCCYCKFSSSKLDYGYFT